MVQQAQSTRADRKQFVLAQVEKAVWCNIECYVLGSVQQTCEGHEARTTVVSAE